MIFYLLPSLILLVLGSIQYINCIRMSKARPLRKNTHFLGVICALALCGLFIVGFVFSEWWILLIALSIGAILSRILQSKFRPPELIYFSAGLSIPLVVLFIEAI